MYLAPRDTLSENVFWGDRKRLWGFKKYFKKADSRQTLSGQTRGGSELTAQAEKQLFMNEGAVRVTLPLRLHVGHCPSEPRHQSSHGSPSALCSPWGRGRQKEQRSKEARRVWLPAIKPRHGCGFRDAEEGKHSLKRFGG